MRQFIDDLLIRLKTHTSLSLVGESGCGKDFVLDALQNKILPHAGEFVRIFCEETKESTLLSLFSFHSKESLSLLNRLESGVLLIYDPYLMSFDVQSCFLAMLKKNPQIRTIFLWKTPPRFYQEQGLLNQAFEHLVSSFLLKMPSLRERPEDIFELASYWAHEEGIAIKGQPLELAPDVRSVLMHYSWPGNMRELKNVIQRAVLMSNNKILGAEYFTWLFQKEHTQKNQPIDFFNTMSLDTLVSQKLEPLVQTYCQENGSGLYSIIMEQVEKTLLALTLKHVNENQSRAARVLGVNRNTLRTKMKLLDMCDKDKNRDNTQESS